MTRTFKNFDEYCNFYNEHKHQMNDVDIVENELTISADSEFECKSWKTAIRRFFKAIEGKFDTQGFDEQWLRECIEESDCWQEKCEVYNRETGKNEYVPGGYHWSVEPTIEGCWYVELTVGK